MADLSSDVIDELRKVFEHFDENHDGQVTAVELKNVMEKALGAEITLEYAQHLIGQASNGGKFVNFDDFLQFMKKKMHPEFSDDDILDAFKEFDHDNNGVITRDELKQAMINLGEDLTDEEVDAIMKQADNDENGTIDIKEFKRIVLGHQ